MSKYIKPSSVKIVYFSGTGGTRRVADGFATAFEDRKIVVNKYELKKFKVIDAGNEDMLIVIFPVHAFNAPKPIYEYIKSLVAVEGIPAVVISISGGGEITPNTASRTHCIKKLEIKGYDVVYEEMLIMPSNFAVPTPDGLSIRLLEILPQKIDKIVSDLISTVRHRTKPNLLNKFMSSLGEAEKSSFASRWFAKQIKVNENCTGCGICANSCPRMNIKMKKQCARFWSRLCAVFKVYLWMRYKSG